MKHNVEQKSSIPTLITSYDRVFLFVLWIKCCWEIFKSLHQLNAMPSLWQTETDITQATININVLLWMKLLELELESSVFKLNTHLINCWYFVICHYSWSFNFRCIVLLESFNDMSNTKVVLVHENLVGKP